MKAKKTYQLLLLFFIIIFFQNCSKEQVTTEKTIADSTLNDPDLQKIKAIGLSPYGVIKTDDGYIVEGDILISQNQLDSLTRIKKNNNNVSQFRTYNLITPLPKTISVSVNAVNWDIGGAVNEAISRYNNLKLDLKFERVNGQADINISETNDTRFNAATSGGPQGGAPGSNIYISTPSFQRVITNFGLSTAKSWLTTVIQHELGHAIGLRHTDLYNRAYSNCYVGPGYPANEQDTQQGQIDGAVNIPGTPFSPDPNSIMLACMDDGVSKDFSADDIIALDYLYKPFSPAPLPTPNTKAVYRLLDIRSGLHLVSSNNNEVTNLRENGWKYEELMGYMYVQQVQNSIPVYRFRHSSNSTHYCSINPNPPAGFILEGPMGYVPTTEDSLSTPVYKFYINNLGENFYTVNFNEINLQDANFTYLAVSFRLLK